MKRGALVGAVLLVALLWLPHDGRSPPVDSAAAPAAGPPTVSVEAPAVDPEAAGAAPAVLPSPGDMSTAELETPASPATTSAPSVGPPTEAPASPDPLPAAVAPAAPPPLPRLPDLPIREVQAPRVNTVKAIPEPPPSQSEILDREWAAKNGGKAQANAAPSGQPNAALPGQNVPRGTLTMRGTNPLDLNSSFPSGGSAPARNAPAPGVDRLSGPAEAVGPTSIRVNGTTLRFHGVLATARAERCGPNKGEPRRCVDAARDWLRTRFKDAPMVSCRLPGGGQPVAGSEIPAVCRDSAGVDLGGMLVLEGLAQADQSVSNEYARAEGNARQAKKGLWLFR